MKALGNLAHAREGSPYEPRLFRCDDFLFGFTPAESLRLICELCRGSAITVYGCTLWRLIVCEVCALLSTLLFTKLKVRPCELLLSEGWFKWTCTLEAEFEILHV